MNKLVRSSTLLVLVGATALAIGASASPSCAAEEIARPSHPGGPGAAASLPGDAQAGAKIYLASCLPCHGAEGKQGIPNPGSSDGSVPPLNPVDATLLSPDPKVFAANLDLFIEHGSTPDGPKPVIVMPAWGADKLLTQQQIADVIAYLRQLNSAR